MSPLLAALDKLKDALRGLFPTRIGAVCVFVPRDGPEDTDIVAAFAASVAPFLRRRVAGTVVLEGHEAPSGMPTHGIRKGSRLRVLLFAHGKDDGTGFYQRAQGPSLDQRVDHAAQELASGQQPILLAHACEGASVLRRAEWTSVVPQWASQRGKPIAFLASRVAIDRWCQVAVQLAASVAQNDTASGTARAARATFEDALVLLDQSFTRDAGDALNQVAFSRARRSIVPSDEGL